ncbi:hypothetical protein AAC691_17040 [Nguyenibacter vanlangensis]|uniref:Intracellular septation protein A n=1 Tax=Nguyenibacter vanlangensis TaxID=1216886 RepID=A0ABZ3D2H4_9PROT
MYLRIVRSALPLIMVVAISRLLPPDWAAASWAVLLGVHILIAWRRLRTGSWLSWAGAALLALFFLNDVAVHVIWADRHATFLFYAFLAVTGLTSLVVNRPFTLADARLAVPRQHWSTPAFIAINRTISAAWSVTFLVNAFIAGWSPLDTETTAGICYLGIIATIIFSDRYPAWCRRRMARARSGFVSASEAAR